MRVSFLGAALLLAACGSKGDLVPAAGKTLPPVPHGASAAPTVQQMLIAPPEAAPERTDDPVKNAKPRVNDRFELPPPG